MYISLVRPHLEYMSQVWNTYKTGEINSLACVQKFALIMCTKQWNSSYNDLLQLCSLPTLQQHRLYLDLCTMFKIVQGLFTFPTGIFVEQTPRVTWSQSHHLFVEQTPRVTRSQFHHLFVEQTPRVTRSQSHHLFVEQTPRVTRSQSHHLFVEQTPRVTRSQSHHLFVEQTPRVTRSQSHHLFVEQTPRVTRL